MPDIRLGLIGDTIAQSKAPFLHRLAGRQCGLSVSYDLLVPREQGLDFDALFDRCATAGYRGVNITYPYKESAASRVTIKDPAVRAIAAVNTVVFERDGPVGHNTDHSGFVAAYHETFGTAAPSAICLVGAGGVGKAIAFALLELGAEEIRIVERDLGKAQRLAESIRFAKPKCQVSVSGSVEDGTTGAQGLINCTPVGMVGHDGTPIAKELMTAARWAFDAVYTPVKTQFLRDASAAGLTVMSGYELFFHQGLDAFRLFCGQEIDQAALRAGLRRAAT